MHLHSTLKGCFFVLKDFDQSQELKTIVKITILDVPYIGFLCYSNWDQILLYERWLESKTLFTWSGGPQSSRVGFFCFHALADKKTKETYPTRPGSPTPCKQALRMNICSALWSFVNFYCLSQSEVSTDNRKVSTFQCIPTCSLPLLLTFSLGPFLKDSEFLWVCLLVLHTEISGQPRPQGTRLFSGKLLLIQVYLKHPYSNQATQAKFSYPKKSWNRKFQTQKNPSIIPVTWNPKYPPRRDYGLR